MSRRIGIYAGSFDPVHKGHVAFALEALEVANLDLVYFLPETQPRHKTGITHATHRLSMLKLATRAHPKLKVLELPDKRFSVATTLPRLKKKFPDDQLMLLVGSDVLMHLPRWKHIDELLLQTGLMVAVRSEAEISVSMEVVNGLPKPLRELHIIESLEPTISSRHIRQSIRLGHKPRDILPSVYDYSKKHWLYEAMPSHQ